MKQSIVNMMLSSKPGIYPLRDNYDVFREVSFKNKIYKVGSVITLLPSEAEYPLRKNFVKFKNDRFRINSICDILDYIDERSPEMPDVEFSSDFTKIKIYPINYERSEDPV
jgi:hypothetical protein